MAAPTSLTELAVPLDLEPMEAKLVTELPEAGDWQFEPKWDGFRCLAFRAGDEVDLRAKSGKPLARYFPEVVAFLKALKPKCFVLDGELAIPVGKTLSFDALQQRVHPAESRVKTLAAETPAVLILFDMLVDAKNKSLIEMPLTKRRAALEAFYKSVGDRARKRMATAGAENGGGSAFRPGDRRALPPRHQAGPFPARKSAHAVHLRADRPAREAAQTGRRHARRLTATAAR